MLADSERELNLALELATRASQLGKSHDTLDTLGWVHFKRADSQLAIDAFEKALVLRPSSPSVRYRLGLALAAKGNSEGALAALRQALEVDSFPEVEAARAELARLEGS
jgi:Flp pilus assembly protein TadD